MKFFSDIAKGLKWIGKELTAVPSWIGKVVKIADDAEAVAPELATQVITVFDDCDAVVLAAVKDGGADLSAAETLASAIVAAAAKDGIDIASDAFVVTAFNEFIAEIKDGKNYVDVLVALKKLVTDYDAFGASAKAAIEKIKTDAEQD